VLDAPTAKPPAAFRPRLWTVDRGLWTQDSRLRTQDKLRTSRSGRRGEHSLTRVIDAKFAARKAAIKTPDDDAKLVEEFKQTVLDYDGPDALDRCKKFTEAWVQIGGNQDELAGECRWAVKMLRQKAGLLLATDPRMAEVAREIRNRSQTVLRNPANHESARH
jgi:hypothetical protein